MNKEKQTFGLEELPQTKSGCVRKSDALHWIRGLPDATEDDFVASIVPKPNTHKGSSFAEPISNIRVTGEPHFIAVMASLLKPMLVWENSATYMSVNLQETKDRESEEGTGNYALYLSVNQRGGEAQFSQALLGGSNHNDQKVLDAFDSVENESEFYE